LAVSSALTEGRSTDTVAAAAAAGLHSAQESLQASAAVCVTLHVTPGGTVAVVLGCLDVDEAAASSMLSADSTLGGNQATAAAAAAADRANPTSVSATAHEYGCAGGLLASSAEASLLPSMASADTTCELSLACLITPCVSVHTSIATLRFDTCPGVNCKPTSLQPSLG
jgi:hypothetical protein